MPRRLLVAPAALAAALIVAGAAGGDAPTLTVAQTLAGLNDVASGGYEPPDVQVAAGPGFLAQTTNLALRIWRTSGATAQQVVQAQPLSDFFRTGSDRLTDPRILYDAPSGRWFASISDIDTDSVVLAVSRTTDPTAAWSTWSFSAPGCPDQPRLGVADGTVVLSADVFRDCSEGAAPVRGSMLWIVNKQQLLAGATSVASTTYGPDRAFETLTPVQSLSPTATLYVVSVDNPSSQVVRLLTVDGIPPAAVSVRPAAVLSIAPLSQPPAAQQPPVSGGGRQSVVATNDDRILDAVWESGKLWFSANTGCTPSGDTVVRSCARVVELATATRTVTWDTDFGFPNAYLFYPAIRPDAFGNLVIVLGESGPAVLPELVAFARTPDGVFTPPAVIAQSTVAATSGRYGDYFGAARDPAHPEIVWVAGQHGSDARGRGWSTSVAAVRMPAAAPPPPPQAVGVAPPSLRAQRVVARRGTVVRLPYRSLGEGADVRQQVTIRSASRSVFNGTTASGRLHADQVYFVVWRPAKTLRGIFTWCVRSVGADGQRAPQSCATVTLR